MEVTHENSMKVYRHLVENPPPGPQVPFKPLRKGLYAIDGKSVVALVRADNRRDGINEAFRLIGGSSPLIKGVKGDIVIKPNLNTDDPFPRNTHPDTIRIISESLIKAGFPPGQIVVGESSGRARGLPTRHTMVNMGIKAVADDLGIQLSCFEEEEYVTVKPPKSRYWPDGIKIPRRIYEAERVILAPVMDLHRGPITFTLGLKLGVGLLDPVGREWLHNGPDYPEPDFLEKCVEINLAYSADLVVMDGMRFRRARAVFPFDKGEIIKVEIWDFPSARSSYLPSLPKSKLRYIDKIKQANRRLAKDKPWVRGLYEGIIAFDILRKKKFEKGNRIGLILIDSTLEIGFKEYLVNESGNYYSDTELRDLFRSRHKLHKLMESDYGIKKTEMDKIRYYHEIRNKLIHERASVSISDEDLYNYRGVVERVLHQLYDLTFDV